MALLEDISCLLKKLNFEDNYVQLGIEYCTSPLLEKSYLLREVLKTKSRLRFKPDGYIMFMSQRTEPIQFFYTFDGLYKTTYLTGPKFSFGLEMVDENVEHVIKNICHSSPLYIFMCDPSKVLKYRESVNAKKAVTNKSWVLSDFRLLSVAPSSSITVPLMSVYFLYSVSHSHFSRENRVPSGSFQPSGSLNPSPDVTSTSGTSGSNYNQLRSAAYTVSSLPGCRCRFLEDLNMKLLQEIERLRKENDALRKNARHEESETIRHPEKRVKTEIDIHIN